VAQKAIQLLPNMFQLQSKRSLKVIRSKYCKVKILR